jgi:signal peptidase I
VERCLAIAGVLFIVYHLCFESSYISSSSMAPTLNGPEKGPADWMLSDKWTFRFRAPRRWEVAMLRETDGILVAKRVVGLPGEEVSIRDGKVCIGGQPLTPPGPLSYLNYIPGGRVAGGRSLTVRPGHYFVLGDDFDSQDSRYEGDLSGETIEGRPLVRIWPLRRVGFINP